MKVVERKFRGSLICRVLGYPISYGVVKMLLAEGPMTLGQIVPRTGRSKPTLCIMLTKLRLTNIVRYERRGRSTTYWIKYPSQVKRILNACDLLVGRMSRGLDRDF